jgi:cyclase
VCINSGAVRQPELLSAGAERFGSQCIILAIDARPTAAGWEVVLDGGRTPTGLDAVAWARRGVELGAGEILLTSMATDGTLDGFDLPLTRAVAAAVDVQIIASGGAGRVEHFAAVLTEGRADAALAASLFHDRKLSVSQVKQELHRRGIPVRLVGAGPARGLQLRFDSRGLIPAVAQHRDTGQVLMVAWMNAEALALTRRTGEAHFFSRSRQALWRKGETSGHVLRVSEIWVDCDEDTLLLRVTPTGPACHTGAASCFFRRLE